MPTIKCTTCECEFHKKPSHIKKNNFCSKPCLEQWRGSKTTVICDECHNEIVKIESGIREHNFCDQKCYGKWRSRTIRGENHPGSFLQEIACESCGKSFKPYQSTIKFCSIECGNKGKERQTASVCDTCGSEYSVANSSVEWSEARGFAHSFCSKECQYGFHKKENHPRWIKDRSKIKNSNKSLRETPEMKSWRKSVFSRDNWTCQLCEDRSRRGHGVVLNAHHIKRVVDYPELALDVKNGVTLCECHKKTYGKEQLFESRFLAITGT